MNYNCKKHATGRFVICKKFISVVRHFMSGNQFVCPSKNKPRSPLVKLYS